MKCPNERELEQLDFLRDSEPHKSLQTQTTVGGIHMHMCVRATVRGGEEMVSRPRVLPTNLHELYPATSRP